MEKQLPRGIFSVSDGKEISSIDTRSHHFQTDYTDSFLKRTEELKNLAQNYEIGYLPIRTDENIVSKIFAYCIGEKK